MRAHFHVGAIGNGNRAKLAINLILSLNRAALTEGLVFANAVGLDPTDILELAKKCSAASVALAAKCASIVDAILRQRAASPSWRRTFR
ncbi:MAG: NAD-binding protein [Pseudomonadota bacterium]